VNVSILDIGISNIFSLKSNIESLGYNVKIINHNSELDKADKIIFPGVGSFKAAMSRISDLNLHESLYDNIIIKKKIFLGICVGMQVLAKNGYEMGDHKGLGFVKGEVKNLKELGCSLQIPHVGWNHVFLKKNEITKNIPQNSDFYFIHSYAFTGLEDKNIIGTTEYDFNIISIINENNIFGTQFHPEKSSKSGKILIKNFLEI
tara:strand:+ start:6969 stop:7580 length:612 start_codon:yes stop_codon:yes gene_type:complete